MTGEMWDLSKIHEKLWTDCTVGLLQFLAGGFDLIKLLIFSHNPSSSSLFSFLENQLNITEQCITSR